MNCRFTVCGVGVVAVLSAGCLRTPVLIDWAPETPWVASPCDPTPGATISGNASKAPPFRGDLQDLVRRLAEGVGDPLEPSRDRVYKTGDGENGPAFHEWATRHGRIVYEHRPTNGQAQLRYEAERVWPSQREDEGAQDLRRVLERLDVFQGGDFTFEVRATTADGVTRSNPRILQWFNGRPLATAVVAGDVSSDLLHPGGDPNSPFLSQIGFQAVYDLSVARTEINTVQTVDLAKTYLACMHATTTNRITQQGELALDVRHGSLTWVVQLVVGMNLGCHDVTNVYVDSETGAVHGHEVGGVMCVD